jgi:hypothetical protein
MQEKDESEPKESPPSDLKGFDKEIFKQQHDERSSEVILLDAAGTETARVKTWFGALAEFAGAWDDQKIRFFGLHNKNLETDSAGATLAMFQSPISYNEGIGISLDQQSIAFGSAREGAILSLPDGASVVFEFDRLPGFDEYVVGFAFAPDGSVYAGTTAYRVLHIAADGTLLAAQPVY